MRKLLLLALVLALLVGCAMKATFNPPGRLAAIFLC